MYDASQHICFNLGRVMRRINSYYQQRLSPFGLTVSQFFVFNALWIGDGFSFSELAERVYLDSSTLTGIIDRLERDGLVERRQDPQDRRSIQVFLTPKAKKAGPRVLELANELDASLRQSFPKADMETFEGVLRALAEKEI